MPSDPTPTRTLRGRLSPEARSCAACGAALLTVVPGTGCGTGWCTPMVQYPTPHGGVGYCTRGYPTTYPTPSPVPRAAARHRTTRRNGPLGSTASQGARLTGIPGNTRGIHGNTREYRVIHGIHGNTREYPGIPGNPGIHGNTGIPGNTRNTGIHGNTGNTRNTRPYGPY